ncbi:hypothetical protein Q604_UNBc4C00145G0001, partial [human gut metagenome]
FLTKNGRGRYAIMDIQDYERLWYLYLPFLVIYIWYNAHRYLFTNKLTFFITDIIKSNSSHLRTNNLLKKEISWHKH